MKLKLLHIALGNHNGALWKAFEKHFTTTHYNWLPKLESPKDVNNDIINLYNSVKPDIVWMQIQRGGIITEQTASYMSRNSYVANWTGDVRSPLPDWFVHIGKHISISLFSNMTDVLKMRALGLNADYMQVGFDEKIFTPFNQKQPNNQIVFMGSNYLGTENSFPLSPMRQNMVQRLTNEFPNFRVYGNNWQGITKKEDTYLDVHEESNIYRNSLMSVNLSHFDYDRYSSDRIFRMIGSGSFCLSHEYKNIEKDFEINEHVATWGNLDELVLKIRYYNQNHYERERIRMNGCNFVRENCNWDIRIQEFKNLIS